MLPHGSGEARGCVSKLAQENDGNLMGHDNPNPIIDSRQYVVKFEDGNEDELTANAIAHSMYAQYVPDGYKYFMIDCIVDFCRNTTALCYSDKNFVKNGRTYRRRSIAVLPMEGQINVLIKVT